MEISQSDLSLYIVNYHEKPKKTSINDVCIRKKKQEKTRMSTIVIIKEKISAEINLFRSGERRRAR